MTAASSTTPPSSSAQVHPLVRGGALGVGLDQRQQVLDQRTHPPCLEAHPLHGPIDGGAVRQRPGAVQVGVPADRGHRGAELVRGVRDELPEPVLAAPAVVQQGGDAVEHAVEGRAQPADLGARDRRPPPGGSGRPAAMSSAASAIVSSGRSSRRITRPAVGAEQDQQADGDQQFDQHQPAEGLVDVVQRHPGDQVTRFVVDAGPGSRAPGSAGCSSRGVLDGGRSADPVGAARAAGWRRRRWRWAPGPRRCPSSDTVDQPISPRSWAISLRSRSVCAVTRWIAADRGDHAGQGRVLRRDLRCPEPPAAARCRPRSRRRPRWPPPARSAGPAGSSGGAVASVTGPRGHHGPGGPVGGAGSASSAAASSVTRLGGR